jgi:hypothetical protein
MTKGRRIALLEQELAYTKKRLSNLSVDISIAVAFLSNDPDVNSMTHKELLDRLFDELVVDRDKKNP